MAAVGFPENFLFPWLSRLSWADIMSFGPDNPVSLTCGGASERSSDDHPTIIR